MLIAFTNNNNENEIIEAERITVHNNGSVSCLCNNEALTLYHNSTPEKIFSALAVGNLALLSTELSTSSAGNNEFLPADVIE